MYKGHPPTSHATRGSRTLTESLPPIQARVVARLAAAQARESRQAGARGKTVRVLEMEASVQNRVRAILRERAGAASARLGDPAACPAACAELRDAALARFTREELAIAYTAGGGGHTLNELIHMLFDPANPRARADAAELLSPILP